MKNIRYLLLPLLIAAASSLSAQQLKQIQKGTDKNQIPVTNGNQHTQVYRDAIPYILDTLGLRDTINTLIPPSGSGSVTSIATTAPVTGGTITATGTIGLDINSTTLEVDGSDKLNAKNSSPIWNADKLQGKDVSSTAPTTGQVLKWNGSTWLPSTDATGSGTVTSVGLTAGTSGTDVNVSGSPITTSGTFTLNIPTASATNRGALSSSDWTTFNNKVGGSGAANKVTYWTSATNISYNNNFHWDNTNGRLGIGTASPTYQLTTTQDVLLNGIRAGKGNGSLTNNTVFGTNSGNALTGDYNTFFGYGAGSGTTTGVENVGLGWGAFQNGKGSWNIAIGSVALKSNNANSNVAIGAGSLQSNTTGTQNVGIGLSSLASNIGGNQNLAIGTFALQNANSSLNIGIGANAGFGITSGSGNMLIGTLAGEGLTTQSGNVAIGSQSMRYASGNWNTGIGGGTLSNVSGSFNTAIGGMGALTTGSNNVGIGAGALNSATTGGNNTAIGNNALNSTVSGFYNVGIGENALKTNTIGTSNTSIGVYSGFKATGDQNIFIGQAAGYPEEGSSKLYITSYYHSTLSNARTRSIIYGEMDGLPANQNLHLNAKVKVSEKPSAATVIAGYDASGYFANVTLGSGLSLSGGTLSNTATAPNTWADISGNVINWNATGSFGSGKPIGIGTLSPARLLDLNGDAQLRGAIYSSTGSAGSTGQVLTSNGTGSWSWQNPSGSTQHLNFDTKSGADVYLNISGGGSGVNFRDGDNIELVRTASNVLTVRERQNWTLMALSSGTTSLSTSNTKITLLGGGSYNGDATDVDYDNTNNEIDVLVSGTYRVEYISNCKSNTASHNVTFDILNSASGSSLSGAALRANHYFDSTNNWCAAKAMWIVPISAGTSFYLAAKTTSGTPNINTCEHRLFVERLK